MSKKHPLIIHVEHNEFRFDAVITNPTEAQNQIGPLATYILERVQEAQVAQTMQQTPAQEAQEAAALASMNQAVVNAPPSIEALIEQVADRVIEKMAVLGEQDLERISCRLAEAARTKMKEQTP